MAALFDVLLRGLRDTGLFAGAIELGQLTMDINAVAVRTSALEGSRGNRVSIAVSGLSQVIYNTIPATARRVHVTLNGVNTSAINEPGLQLITGAGNITSGYTGGIVAIGGGNSLGVASTYFRVSTQTVLVRNGLFTLERSGETNTWSGAGSGGYTDGSAWVTNGRADAMAALLGVRLFATSGTFNAGSVEFWWEV